MNSVKHSVILSSSFTSWFQISLMQPLLQSLSAKTSLTLALSYARIIIKNLTLCLQALPAAFSPIDNVIIERLNNSPKREEKLNKMNNGEENFSRFFKEVKENRVKRNFGRRITYSIFHHLEVRMTIAWQAIWLNSPPLRFDWILLLYRRSGCSSCLIGGNICYGGQGLYELKRYWLPLRFSGLSNKGKFQ